MMSSEHPNYGHTAYPIISRRIYNIVGNFRGVQFHRWSIFTNFRGHAHSRPFCNIKSRLFHGFNFHSWAIICENCENWTPHKFPAIWYYQYLTVTLVCTSLTALPLHTMFSHQQVYTYFIMHFGIPKYGEVDLVDFVLFTVITACSILSVLHTFLSNSKSAKAM